MKKIAFMNAGIGFILWLIALLIGKDLNLIEQLLLFAIYVTVPLTLYITETKKRDNTLFKTYQVAMMLHLPTAVLASLSSLLHPGLLAGFLSVGWFLFSGIVFLYGLLRLLARGIHPLEELSIDIGLIYFLLGGTWLSIDRFGIDVMDFSSMIVQLTAIHFHFSAFVLPIFNGLMGRILTEYKNYRIATYGIIAGPILIAIGITYSRLIEFLAVAIFVVALLLFAFQMYTYVIPKLKRFMPRVLLLLSTTTLLLTIALSFLYGFSRMRNTIIISIPDMVLFHGIGNAFVVVFCGVIGCVLIHPVPKRVAYGIPFSKIFSRFHTGPEFFHKEGLIEENNSYDGLVDDMTTYDRSDFQTGNLHPEVVSFYEDTLNYELNSFTRWQPGFIRLSKVYKWFSERIGQINLPLNGMDYLPMTGKILPVQSEKDGRKDVRVWVRTTVTGEPIFAAAYSFHDYQGERYMNIALPLLYGNMTGILKMDGMKGNSGLTLTSWNSDSPGDEGIYYHCRWFTVKLPIREHFRVWYDKDQSLLIATHQMYLLRMLF